ncbi:MAG: ATP-binding protein [Candidatus Methanofastidiosa archaeon]|nr:ATP-binding protein [Candidatus Methanofastidiosa archaeon]
MAVGIKAINLEEKANFFRLHDLINLLENDDEIKVIRIRKKIKTPDLLIADD